MRRIVLFTKNMPGTVAFYRDALEFRLRKDETGWKELDANGCVIALHNGMSEVGQRPPRSASGPRTLQPPERSCCAAAPRSPSSWKVAA